ncbi:MAG: DHA2 family efflux MFS transporter permease subunit [Pyrinomonadaceae bacterium]
MKSSLTNRIRSYFKENSSYVSVIILTLATFMSVLDSTVVNVSLPKMSDDLSTTPTEIIWVVTSYIVAMAAVLPISGWLATYFGRKRYYLASVIGFTAASVMCAFSTSLEMLVFSRIIQGLSAGGIAPSEQAIIADITPKEKLGRTFAIYSLGISVAPILGPTLGGFITDTLSWHWIFLINLPLGIISIVLTYVFVKESDTAEKMTKEFRTGDNTVDWLGVFFFVSGIATLELVLMEGPRENWLESDFVLIMAIYCAFALLSGIVWEYYRRKPAVDVRMFKDRTFSTACILILTVSLVISGSSFLTPFFTQVLLGYSAMDAGMLGLPATIAQMAIIPIVGYFSDKIDVRKIIFIGLAFTAFAVLNFLSFNLQSEYNDIMLARMFYTGSLGFLAATVNTVAYYHISAAQNNSASALLNLVRNVGASLGIALTSTIITVKSQVHINDASYHTNPYNPNFTQAIANLSDAIVTNGLDTANAADRALGVMWQEILRQSTMNAVLDAVAVYVILHLCLIPLVFLLKGKTKDNLV